MYYSNLTPFSSRDRRYAHRLANDKINEIINNILIQINRPKNHFLSYTTKSLINNNITEVPTTRDSGFLNFTNKLTAKMVNQKINENNIRHGGLIISTKISDRNPIKESIEEMLLEEKRTINMENFEFEKRREQRHIKKSLSNLKYNDDYVSKAIELLKKNAEGTMFALTKLIIDNLPFKHSNKKMKSTVDEILNWNIGVNSKKHVLSNFNSTYSNNSLTLQFENPTVAKRIYEYNQKLWRTRQYSMTLENTNLNVFSDKKTFIGKLEYKFSYSRMINQKVLVSKKIDSSFLKIIMNPSELEYAKTSIACFNASNVAKIAVSSLSDIIEDTELVIKKYTNIYLNKVCDDAITNANNAVENSNLIIQSLNNHIVMIAPVGEIFYSYKERKQMEKDYKQIIGSNKHIIKFKTRNSNIRPWKKDKNGIMCPIGNTIMNLKKIIIETNYNSYHQLDDFDDYWYYDKETNRYWRYENYEDDDYEIFDYDEHNIDSFSEDYDDEFY